MRLKTRSQVLCKANRIWKRGWLLGRNIEVKFVCTDVTRKAKACLESNLARVIKDNSKVVFKYVKSKTKTKENSDL